MSTLLRLVLFGTLALASAAVAHEAHQHATGPAAERADLMKEVGQATKQSGNMLNGKAAFDPALLKSNADLIARSGGSRLTALFPPGSDTAASEALPSIWEDWPRFQAYADQMSRLAEALSLSAGHARAASAAPDTSGGALLGSTAVDTRLLTDQEIDALAAGPPGPAFEALVKTCSACHTAFRKPK